MKYSGEAYEKAMRELSRRRNAANEEHQRRTEEINSIAPEIGMLQKKLAETSAGLVKAVLSGGENAAQMIEKVKQTNLRMQKSIGDMLYALKGDSHYLDVPYFCNKCKDEGFVNGVRCECMKKLLDRYAIDEISEGCHIKTHDFSEFRLEYYDVRSDNGYSPREKMSQVYNYCKSYAENFPKDNSSLFFYGKTGLGKTFLSSCIAQEVIHKGHSVLFGSISEFLRAVENEHFNRAEGDTMSALMNCELLILDDLGSEFRTPFNESAVYSIINGRLNMDMPTIVSTNLSLQELDQIYNERIVSRLTGCYSPILFIGRDIRHVKRQFEFNT